MTKIVTLNELHENTSGVIHEMNLKRQPFVLTRRGRILALVTPVSDELQGEPVERAGEIREARAGLFCPVHQDWHPSPVCDPEP
jgi:hypothetical protein